MDSGGPEFCDYAGQTIPLTHACPMGDSLTS